MDLEVTQYRDVEVVKCHNNIDAFTAMEFQPMLLQAIDNCKGNLCIDLSDVDYVSSAGMRALLVAHRKLASRGNSLYLIDASASIAELLRISGLNKIIHVIGHPCEAMS